MLRESVNITPEKEQLNSKGKLVKGDDYQEGSDVEYLQEEPNSNRIEEEPEHEEEDDFDEGST